MSRLKNWAKSLVMAAAVTTAFLPFGSVMWSTQVYAAESLKMVEQSPITSGATLKKYQWQFERKGKPVTVNANVIVIDLQNPYVKLDTMMGTESQYTRNQNMLNMARENEAVAAVNADYYIVSAEGAPLGPQIKDGEVHSSPAYLVGFQSFALTKDNEPIIDEFTFEGAITAKNGASYPLSGINKTNYWYDDDGVHTPGVAAITDSIIMYTPAWGKAYTSYIYGQEDAIGPAAEIIVQNGTIKRIATMVGTYSGETPPEDGYVLLAWGKAKEFVEANLKVGQKLKADYRMFAEDPNKVYDPATFKTMIGGHTILVEDGKPSAYSRAINEINYEAARTAIGFSKDKRYVYLVTADRSQQSAGLLIPELQNFMVNIGVWRGMNLDGGGSTQMVSRPLGDTQVQYTNQTQNGEKRRVVNGLGVWSLAPKGTEAKGIAISGRAELLIGQSSEYSLRGYDEYYNPMGASDLAGEWSATGNGLTDGHTLTATAPGQIKLQAKVGTAVTSKEVRVLGGQDLESLKITGNLPELKVGTTYPLPSVVAVTASEGTERAVPAVGLKWEFVGFEADIHDGKMTIRSVDGEQPAYLIVDYDGFSTSQLLSRGDTAVFADFQSVLPAITKQVTPATVTGDVYVVTEGSNRSLKLSYDFTGGGEVTKALYAQFGNGGQPIEGSPSGMTLRVKGDNSRNWMRVEVKDAEGTLRMLDITRDLNWTGWKTVQVPFDATGLKQPLKINRIYVANPANGQSTRAATGAVEIDDMWLHYPLKSEQVRNEVSLTIDQKVLTVNGQAMELDQAPVIDQGNTLVPVRFVVEAMGGQILWNATDIGQSVQVLKGANYIHMWLGRERMAIDGKAAQAEVPPQLMNNRTMVPLRMVAEAMGWDVGWDGDNRTVTLK